MSILNLTANALTSTLPPSWGEGMTSLGILGLGSNKLQGAVPTGEQSTSSKDMPAAQG